MAVVDAAHLAAGIGRERRRIELLQTVDESVERPDDSKAGQDAGQVLEVFGAEPRIDDRLDVEKALRGDRGPNGNGPSLTVDLFILLVQRLFKFLPAGLRP